LRGGLQGIGHIPMYQDAYWEECCKRLGYKCPTKSEFYKQLRYIPLPTMELMHRSRVPHRVVAGGNRSGKTYAAAMEVMPYLLWLGTTGWYISANYDLADEFHRKIEDILVGRLGMERVLRNDGLQPWEFTYSPKTHILNMGTGSSIQLKSSDAPNSMHAVPVDYIVNDEAALMPYIMYDTRLIPRLTDSGGWILNIGTFESYEPTGEWFEEYFDIGQEKNDIGMESWHHPTEDNYHVYVAKGGETSEDIAEIYSTNWSKVEESNPGVVWPLMSATIITIWNIDLGWLAREKKRISPEVYAARYDAKRSTSPFLVFPKWSTKKYASDINAAFDPELPVYIAIDTGGTYAVAAIQIKPSDSMVRTDKPELVNSLTKGYDMCIIDELYYQTTVTTEEVFLACSQREWWPNLNRTDHDWWPAMQGAIDVTSKEQTRNWQQLARKDPILKSLRLRGRKGDINAGIETLQHFLDTDSIWVNRNALFLAIEMRKYQHQSPGYSRVGTEDPRKKDTPKDAWNHLIKAITYFIIEKFGYFGRTPSNAVLSREKLNEYFHQQNVREKKRGRSVVYKYA
jgi:hypothetical protein